MSGWRKVRIDYATARAYRERWSFPVKARVTHPDYYPVVVPSKSNLCAVMCAAEKWGVDYHTVLDAKVTYYEEKEKAPASGADNTTQGHGDKAPNHTISIT